MPEITAFLGINNVEPEERLKPGELRTATNVDIGLSGEISRRKGSTLLQAGAYHSLYEGEIVLAVREGALVRLNPTTGAVLATIVGEIGARRVSYQAAPNGRVYFTNGVTMGSTDGTDYLPLGVPRPPHIGDVGSIGPGLQFTLNVALGYRRQADGLEGGLTHGLAQTNGTELSFVGLPQLDGYDIVVYGAPAQHQNLYRLGTTSGETFAFRPADVSGGIGAWDALGLASESLISLRITEFFAPPPSGTILGLWNGRLLMADGQILWASRPYMLELFDLRRDYKPFEDDVTLVIPMKAGIWVGTTAALYFLRGNMFDKLALELALPKPVVRGSDVLVDGSMVKGRLDNTLGNGDAALCVVGGAVTALTSAGQAIVLTDTYYTTDATEMVASVVTHNGYPQYLATPL